MGTDDEMDPNDDEPLYPVKSTDTDSTSSKEKETESETKILDVKEANNLPSVGPPSIDGAPIHPPSLAPTSIADTSPLPSGEPENSTGDVEMKETPQTNNVSTTDSEPKIPQIISLPNKPAA